MTFHAITTKANPGINSLLKAACEQRSLPYEFHDPNTTDFSAAKPLPSGDLLYRVAAPRQRSHAAHMLELLLRGPGVATFYQTADTKYDATSIASQYRIFQQHEIPLPRTILHVTPDRNLLLRYVEQLGGFPVVIKTLHGSHGIGTIKVESAPSLLSVVDLMAEMDLDSVLQQFVPATTSARLIVVGDRVIDSLEYQASESDFRSNAGRKPTVTGKEFSPAMQQTAVQAVAVLGLEAGGVDLLLNEEGQHYVAEVNFPFNFARAQNLTGIDSAGSMIDFLIEKSQRLAQGISQL